MHAFLRVKGRKQEEIKMEEQTTPRAEENQREETAPGLKCAFTDTQGEAPGASAGGERPFCHYEI